MTMGRGPISSSLVFALQGVVLSQRPQPLASEVLFPARVSQSQQGRKSAAMAQQARKPGPLPWRRQRGTGAAMAEAKSRLLETAPQGPGYVTRSLKCTTDSKTASCINELSGTVTRFRGDARSSVGGTYLPVDRLTVTRAHRADRPAAGIQGPEHSGHVVRKPNERKNA